MLCVSFSLPWKQVAFIPDTPCQDGIAEEAGKVSAPDTSANVAAFFFESRGVLSPSLCADIMGC